MHSFPYMISFSSLEYRSYTRRTLFSLPPSLLRNIIQRSQLSQNATINPTMPATAIPLPNETLGE